MRRPLVLPVILLALGSARISAAPAIQFEEIVSPAALGAIGASLATAPDGTLWLSWVEPVLPGPTGPAAGGARALRFSTLDPVAHKWTAPRTVATGPSLTADPTDFPQLVVTARGEAIALWTDGHGGALLSRSADGGARWRAPAAFTRESEEVEKFSLAVLADDRVLIAWLDGRGKKTGGKTQQLYARVLDSPGPDMLVDPSVCDCCPTTLTAFPDGGALLAYRGRTEDEVRDIRTARFRGRKWDEPRPLGADDWHINGCPVNGPQIASDGGRVAAAWFTAANNDPRVLASFSPDAGARFLQPLRIDHGKPTGQVDTLILHDGALLVTWLENDGSLWLRRITPDFTADAPIALAPAGPGRVSGFPRMALVRDYACGRTTAQFVTAFVRETSPATLHTLLVTVPEGQLIEAEKNCDCAPTPEQLLGFAMRGTIAAVASNQGTVRVRHDEVPGVLAAGLHEFSVSPDVIAAVSTGRQFLGRIERRAGAWRLFDVRLFVAK
jgi:hypothetical protein